jgi:hypothetical protein
MATKKKVKTTNRSTKVKAKPLPKKKKAPAKKKATKKVANPHVGKRFFKIELSGYGGELIVGRSSEEFVQYWLDEDRKDSLIDHMHAMNDMIMYEDDDDMDVEGFDEDSPEVYEGSGKREYWEFDDIEHETLVSYDHNLYTVTEINVDPRAVYKDGELSWTDKVSSKRNFDWSSKKFTEIDDTSKEYSFDNCVATRELYVHDSKDGVVDPVPVIMMYDSQKGVFGHVYVMTDGEDFDPDKFVYVAFDNTMTSHAEMFFYNKQLLTVDNNELSTWGKGFYASVGYVPKGELEYDLQAAIEEGWEFLDGE